MHDRLKKFDVDRNDFNRWLPRINAGNSAPVRPSENRPKEPKLVEIMSKFKVNSKQHYRVRYSDNKCVCSWVNRALLDHYDCKMKAKNMWTLSNGRCSDRRRH